jgi:spore germination cell wall hydrolase CwlJ-like protein
MFAFTRAAAYAAAFVTMAASAAFADPSMAWDVEAAPITSSYIDHASAELDGSRLAAGIQGPARLSQDVDFSTPVATHAVATVSDGSIDLDEMGEDRPLGELVDDYASATAGNDELKCLASAIYFESKGEPLEGQLAVAEVILNRVKSPKFPDTICGVVKQRSQFSFVHGGHIPSAPTSSEAWRTAVAIARIAKNDLADSAVSTAMFFHATYVRPGWRGLTRVAEVGNHIFYR